MPSDQILHFYDTSNVFQIIDEILVLVMKMTAPFNKISWQKAQFWFQPITKDEMLNFCIANLWRDFEQNLRESFCWR